MRVVEVSITDDSLLGSLESELRREMPQITIRRVPGVAPQGALGWEDILALTLAAISAFDDTIDVIRSYLESRDKGTRVTLTATDASKDLTKSITLPDATSAQVKDFLDWLTDE